MCNKFLNVFIKGVSINGGDRSIIRYNLIQNVGQVIGGNNGSREDGGANHSGVGIYVVNGGDHIIIEYNRIVNTGHNGIHLRHWNAGIVRFNLVNGVDNVLDDGGGIYVYEGAFNRTERNRVISNNIILHGIGAPAGGSGNFAAGAGVAGLYFDLGAHDIEASSNYVAYFGQGTLQNFGTNHNYLHDNTFYSNTLNGIQINTRKKNGDTSRNLVITNNTVIAALKSQKTLVIYSDDGDVLNRLGTIDYNIYARPLDDNQTMSYQSGSEVKISLTAWQVKYPMYDAHSKRSLFNYKTLQNQSDSTNFYYNDSSVSVLVNVLDTSQDMRGNAYAGATSLSPGAALFLFTTGSTTPIPDPPPPPDPPGPVSTSIILNSRLKIISE